MPNERKRSEMKVMDLLHADGLSVEDVKFVLHFQHYMNFGRQLTVSEINRISQLWNKHCKFGYRWA